MTAPGTDTATTTAAAGGTAAVALEDVRKQFPGVRALDGVSFAVGRGEIHALLGENGAGKSTLINIITGRLRPDSGQVVIAGRPVDLRRPQDALAAGITYVPQDVLVVPELSIGRNMLLGHEGVAARRGRLSAGERRRTREALDRMGARFDERTPARRLSVPELRLAQVARALMQEGDVIVLDEPTAALSESDGEHLLERLLALRELGKAIVYVTHRLGEVMRIADRVTVLRDGRKVGEFERGKFDKDTIVARMAKDDAPADVSFGDDQAAPARGNGSGRTLLQVRGLCQPGRFQDVDLEVQEGRIVGIAGVQGSGHGHLLRAIAAVDTCESGVIEVDGRPVPRGSARSRYAQGVVLVPGDRRGAGIVAPLSVRDNLALSPRLRARARWFGMRRGTVERSIATEYVSALSVKTASIDTPVGTLSGGNQQKVVLARAIESDPRVVLVEEPTQGVDVHAKKEIRALLERTAREGGRCVVVATSDFEELIGLADVVHVMCLGRLTATLEGDAINYRDILAAALP